jgi:hypothetical protein
MCDDVYGYFVRMVMKGGSTAEDGSPSSCAKVSLPIYFEDSCGSSGLVFAEPKPEELASVSDETWEDFHDKLNEVARSSPTIPGRCVFFVLFVGVTLLSLAATYAFFGLVGPENLNGRMWNCSGGTHKDSYLVYTDEYCDEEFGWQFAYMFSQFVVPTFLIWFTMYNKQKEIKNWAIANEPNFVFVCNSFSSKIEGHMATSLSTAISLLTFGMSSVMEQ